jgi:hypothetical protein
VGLFVLRYAPVPLISPLFATKGICIRYKQLRLATGDLPPEIRPRDRSETALFTPTAVVKRIDPDEAVDRVPAVSS